MSLSLSVKLASALLHILRFGGREDYNHYVDIICKLDTQMTPDEQAKIIIGEFEFDHHPTPKAEGGTDHPTNIDPLLKTTHRIKTKVDVKQIAKNKRVRAKHDAHLERMRTK